MAHKGTISILADQIDLIKQKLTDDEYKSIMDTLKRMHDDPNSMQDRGGYDYDTYIVTFSDVVYHDGDGIYWSRDEFIKMLVAYYNRESEPEYEEDDFESNFEETVEKIHRLSCNKMYRYKLKPTSDDVPDTDCKYIVTETRIPIEALDGMLVYLHGQAIAVSREAPIRL